MWQSVICVTVEEAFIVSLCGLLSFFLAMAVVETGLNTTTVGRWNLLGGKVSGKTSRQIHLLIHSGLRAWERKKLLFFSALKSGADGATSPILNDSTSHQRASLQWGPQTRLLSSDSRTKVRSWQIRSPQWTGKKKKRGESES